MLLTNDWCNCKVHFSMHTLKDCYEQCKENTVEGVGLSGKYSTRWTQDPTLSTVFFCTSQVNSTLTDLLFCIGRISNISSDGLEHNAYKQMEVIVSDSLLVYNITPRIRDGVH